MIVNKDQISQQQLDALISRVSDVGAAMSSTSIDSIACERDEARLSSVAPVVRFCEAVLDTHRWVRGRKSKQKAVTPKYVLPIIKRLDRDPGQSDYERLALRIRSNRKLFVSPLRDQ